MPMDKATWLITGASSGLGYELASVALQHGDQVVLAATALAPMQTLAADFPDSALALEFDVTDAEQRTSVVREAEARFGSIDFLVNNAGIDILGAVEEQDEADYRRLFEVNFFGPVAMLRLVLPGMRKLKKGTIVNMSSMDGIASMAANGYYSASKFALEGITEALWQEIEPLGLRAISVNPGSFRTGIGARTKFSGKQIEAYSATSGAFRKAMAQLSDDVFPGDPSRAADVIFQSLKSDATGRRIILGSDAYKIIAKKIESLQSENEAYKDLAQSTDFAN